MKSIICWRSIFTLKPSRSTCCDPLYNHNRNLCSHGIYRQTCQKTLIFLISYFTLAPLAAWSEDNEAWPEPVYFPQSNEQTAPTAANKPPISKSSPLTQATASKTGAEPNSPHHRHRLWPFGAKTDKPDEPFRVIPPKPSAKIADPPASPYPLLRLTMPIVTEQGVIAPGFYLVKPETTSGNSKIITPANATIDANSPLLLTRQNQVMARIAIHEVQLPDETIAETGTPSPITKANPNIPTRLKIEALLSDDQKTLTLRVKTGSKQFESDAFPVGTDPRRLLTY